jgi:hypothetical protein
MAKKRKKPPKRSTGKYDWLKTLASDIAKAILKILILGLLSYCKDAW